MTAKLSKTALANIAQKEVTDNFWKAYPKCLEAGIRIFPECIVDKTKWRIVIEFLNEEGGVTERVESDPKTYTSIKDYEAKVMELYVHYAKSL